MCSVVGALLANVKSSHDLDYVNKILSIIMINSRDRGRDGWGFAAQADGKQWVRKMVPEIRQEGIVLEQFDHEFFGRTFSRGNFIANLRAEPTTEYVEAKSQSDQQPYMVDRWNVVHNGTIANDKDLRTHILRTRIDSAALPEWFAENVNLSDYEDPEAILNRFSNAVEDIKGSYAILATVKEDDSRLYVSVNYRPVWYITTKYGFFFASDRSFFPAGFVPEMITPYTNHLFGLNPGTHGAPYHKITERKRPHAFKALVVASGGMDSTVAASMALQRGYDIELIHFQYGSRAEGPEVRAVQAIGERLHCKVTLFPLPVYKPGDSPLLQADSTIAGGEEGAEFAHEWVPARNLLLLSVATAYAEANGFDTIVLGNNLEEAGAYPDNEPEFIHKFNDLLPFAVGDGKRMRIEQPVGNMMKHEIVAAGHHLGAPLDLTWSCYRAGEKHCGTCGPCYMRRKAFEINHLPEVITYER